jgi:hypothetical protein
MCNPNYYVPLSNAPTGNTSTKPKFTPPNPTPQYLFVIIREVPHVIEGLQSHPLYAYHSEKTAQSVPTQFIDDTPGLERQRVQRFANVPSWDFRWSVAMNGQFDGFVFINRVELKDYDEDGEVRGR